MYNRNLNEEELCHFGIKGMKWGHRKARYSDADIKAARRSRHDATVQINRQKNSFNLANKSGDRQTKIASTRKIDSLQRQKADKAKVARTLTSGEKKAVAAVGVLAAVTVTAVAAKKLNAGKRIVNAMYGTTVHVVNPIGLDARNMFR